MGDRSPREEVIMKKIWAVFLLAIAVTMMTGICAQAGTFDGYWDFQQEDGSFAYGFPRIKVAIDKTWYRNTKVVLSEGGMTASFYHRASYRAFEKEGMTGGLLFTIGASVNTDFQDLPDVVFLGFDEEEAMNYYASLPTDYQAYAGDEKIRTEYDELFSSVEDVLAGVLIKGSEKYRELHEAEKSEQDPTAYFTSGDYYYSVHDGTAAIVKYNGSNGEIEIPSEIDGYPVTEIGAAAFWGKETKDLIIPTSITRIGERAFEYCKITDSLVLPENSTIAYEAFSDARGLPEAITIPAGVVVEEEAFSYCDTITKAVIGPGVLVRSRAFIYCDGLQEVFCGEGSHLEKKAFEYCAELTRVFAGGTVEIEEDAFLFCNDPEIVADDAVTLAVFPEADGFHFGDIGKVLKENAPGKDDLPRKDDAPQKEDAPKTISAGGYDFQIRDGVASVVKYTGDSGKVTVPSEINEYPVTAIGPEAFQYRKLKSVVVPDSISRIGKQAFEYCEITDSLLLPENIIISEDAFSYAVLPSVVVIPAGSTIEECAFSYCEELTVVCIDAGVTLKGRAFGYCDDLAAAVCAAGSRLEENAFEYCRDMKKVFLCGDVETADGAFYSCGDAELLAQAAEDYEDLKRSLPDEMEDYTPYEAEERPLEIRNSPVTLDGVTVTLEQATACRNPENGGFVYTLGGTLRNDTEEGIMQVLYTFALIDENGEEFRSFGITYDGEDKALEPHAETEFFYDDIKWGKQSIPAAVEIGISYVKTETELPPAHVPQEGEYLYQALGNEKLANIKADPPAELTFHVDQGGYGRTARFTEGEAFERALELFCEIRIGEESGEWVTDNYNGIGLTWADGSYTGISINLDKLEYWIHSTPHTYELENLGDFWDYCAAYLEED